MFNSKDINNPTEFRENRNLESGKILLDYFDCAASRNPKKTAVVTYGSNGQTRLTYADLANYVECVAGSFHRLGLAKGSVISYQLPNWWQAIVIHLAALRIGAVSNPIMPFLRERDLSFMLALAETDIFITPKNFRGFNHQDMAKRLYRKLSGLQHIIVIDGDEEISFDRLLKEPSIAAPKTSLDQEDIVQYLFTSGTTGEPKCVTHSSRSLMAMVQQAAQRLEMSDSDVVFMAMPLSHQGGFITGIVLPIMLGATSILQEIWDPNRAVEIFATEGVTMTLGATPFLFDITDTVEQSGELLPDLRIFLTAGAAIPRNLVARGQSALGCNIIPSWGMSENGFVTMAKLNSSEEKIISTDGCALPMMEVRVVDACNQKIPLGSEGHLQVRGPNLFSGYLKREDLSKLEPDGWFNTGDLARMDIDGYIKITGRTKDIVIRGGENIPVVEIEQVMFRHPAVQEFAIVGMPDDRLGERLCAFAVLRSGLALTIETMIEFLGAQGVTRSYWPEQLVCLDEMPRTPTGKIQKFILRHKAKEIAERRNDGGQHGAS